MKEQRQGFVYVMRSPATVWVKIGRTQNSPHFRARDLSSDPVYGPLGPWAVADYRKVRDMVATERLLHKRHITHNVTSAPGARELFSISEAEAVASLVEVCEADLVGKKPIGRLRLDAPLVAYLSRLFRESGLEQFVDLQEMWTLTLYNSTSGGRHFTLNIDRHEVAYSAPIRGEGRSLFMLYVDALALEVPEICKWVENHHGWIENDVYASGLTAGISVGFEATLDEALNVFQLPMMRRALVAYWYDALLDLRDRNKRSFFARFHNHNAVAEVIKLAKSQKEAQSGVPMADSEDGVGHNCVRL